MGLTDILPWRIMISAGVFVIAFACRIRKPDDAFFIDMADEAAAFTLHLFHTSEEISGANLHCNTIEIQTKELEAESNPFFKKCRIFARFIAI